MTEEDEDYDLYEDLEEPTVTAPSQPLPTRLLQRMRPEDSSAGLSTGSPVSNSGSKNVSTTSAATALLKDLAQDYSLKLEADEEKDLTLIVGGVSVLALPENLVSTEARAVARKGGDDHKRATHFMRRDRTIFLGVPPPLPPVMDAKVSHLLVIGNLPWWLSDVSLRDLSSSFGRVIGVRIFGDSIGAKPSGVALLLYATELHAAAATTGLDKAVCSYGGLGTGSRRLTIRSSSLSIWNRLESLKPHWASGVAVPHELRMDIFTHVSAGFARSQPIPAAGNTEPPREPQPQQSKTRQICQPPTEQQQRSCQSENAQEGGGDRSLQPEGISALFPWFDPSVLQLDGTAATAESSSSSDNETTNSGNHCVPPSNKRRKIPGNQRFTNKAHAGAAGPHGEWRHRRQRQRPLVLPQGANAVPLGPPLRIMRSRPPHSHHDF